MPIEVVALEEHQYLDWVAEQKSAGQAAAAAADKDWGKDDLIAKGEGVYTKNCAACHQASGAGLPGVFPAITGSPVATGPVADHVGIVMNGKVGTAMQAFAGQLDDVDLAAVITYQRNALGNSVGDVVTPQDIKANR